MTLTNRLRGGYPLGAVHTTLNMKGFTMKKILTAGLLALGFSAGSAQAATTFDKSFSTTGAQAAGTAVYQNFDGLAAGTTFGGANIYANTVSGVAEKPTVGSTGNFAAVLAGGLFTTSFTTTNVFSFVLGSLDTYNSLTLRFADGGSQTLTGNDIIGIDGLFRPGGTVTYRVTSGSLLTGATFGSTANSFEFDNLATAVPEPAAWGMMIMGFGLVGGVLRRRSAKVSSTKVSFA